MFEDTINFRCRICKNYVKYSNHKDPHGCTKFILALLLCPFGLFFIPYLHPKFKSDIICPKCSSMAAATGKCKICGELLSYQADDITAFGRHLIEKHNTDQITHFQFSGTGGEDICECGCACGCNCDGRPATHSKAYKTTVESWKQGLVPQECPNCGRNGLPLIRKQRNKVSKNSFGTLCLVGCWPLCFLPFLVAGSDMMYLFCQECGYFLGTYNRKTGSIHHSCPIDSDEYGAKICRCTSGNSIK